MRDGENFALFFRAFLSFFPFELDEGRGEVGGARSFGFRPADRAKERINNNKIEGFEHKKRLFLRNREDSGARQDNAGVSMDRIRGERRWIGFGIPWPVYLRTWVMGSKIISGLGLGVNCTISKDHMQRKPHDGEKILYEMDTVIPNRPFPEPNWADGLLAGVDQGSN